jgi:hypothetical protein
MVEFTTILQFIQAAGIIVGVAYYIMNIENNRRNQETSLKNQEISLHNQEITLETRQTQIFMELYKTVASKEFMMDLETIILHWDFDSYEGFYEKYDSDINPVEHSKFDFLLAYYNGIGLLVQRNLIDPWLVYELLRFGIVGFWEKARVVIEGDRKRYNTPKLGAGAENLYHLMMEYRLKEQKEPN